VTDTIASLIATQLVKVLNKNPKLTDDLTWASIDEGAGDYEQPEGMTISRLALQIGIKSMFGYS
jgi:hypothetical protein